MPKIPKHIAALATTLRETSLQRKTIQLGEIQLKLSALRRPVEAGQEAWQLLQGAHEYSVSIGGKDIDLSIQLYLNPLDHYRLFAFSRVGMLFSLNFTTTEDAAGIISLSQRIKFAEGRSGDAEAAKSIRQAKGRLFADVLVRSGITVTDNLEIDLGTYCSRRREFLDTTPEQFLSKFIAIALLKGHFQGNKGYQFACLPRFDDSFPWQWNTSEEVRSKLVANKKGANGQRAIPLGLRFHVLERNKGKCGACGRSTKDGITLHVDHINPFSLGGLTVLDNLQALCSECNLGKGNRSETRFL